MGNVAMPSEDTKILQFNQQCKFEIAPFIIYGNIEYLMRVISTWTMNSQKSSSAKASEHIP